MGRNWAYIEQLIKSDTLTIDVREILSIWRRLRHDSESGNYKESSKLAAKRLYCTYREERFFCCEIALSGFIALKRVSGGSQDDIDVLAAPSLCTDWSTSAT